MKSEAVVILLHFINILIGIGALLIISRRVNFVSAAVQNSFILQALLFNAALVIYALMDFMYFVFWDFIVNNYFLLTLQRIAYILYLSSFALWSFYYLKMVFTFLDIPFGFKDRNKNRFAIILFALVFITMLVIRLLGIFQHIYSPFFLFVHFASILVIIYSSFFLLKKAQRMLDKNRKRSLTILSILVLIFSFFVVLTILGNFKSFWFIFRTDLFKPILVDFIYNIFILFWAYNYMNLLNTKEEPIPIPKEAIEKVAEKFQISKRELEIIQLVCEGKSNQEIADLLFVSLGTIKSHLYNIYNKIGIKNRIQLTKLF